MSVIKSRNNNSISPYILTSISKVKYRTPNYASKEGVFMLTKRKWIVRVRRKGGFMTLSYHKTEEEANLIYDLYLQSKSE